MRIQEKKQLCAVLVDSCTSAQNEQEMRQQQKGFSNQDVVQESQEIEEVINYFDSNILQLQLPFV